MTLGFMLTLFASISYGSGSMGSIGIDIVGSNAENTSIIAPYGASVDLDIVGSNTNDIQIVPMPMRASVGRAMYGCNSGYCDSCGGNITYSTPWDDFKRPLCYPWSSYIPTRYNRQFHVHSGGIPASTGYAASTPGILKLGMMMNPTSE